MLAKSIKIFWNKQNFFFLIYDFKTENEFSPYLVVESRNGKDEGKKNESLQRKHAVRPTLFALPPVLFDKLKHSKHVRAASIPAHPGRFRGRHYFWVPERQTRREQTLYGFNC